MPELFFLHGNVRIGYCPNISSNHSIWGPIEDCCDVCEKKYFRSELLFPVIKKDYTSDLLINGSWESLKMLLKKTSLLTIFGYGAPESDREAYNIILEAWKQNGKDSLYHALQYLDIVNIEPENALRQKWGDFGFDSQRLFFSKDFSESWLKKHPRRGAEALAKSTLDGHPVSDFPLGEYWDWESFYEQVKKITCFERPQK